MYHSFFYEYSSVRTAGIYLNWKQRCSQLIALQPEKYIIFVCVSTTLYLFSKQKSERNDMLVNN